MPKAEGPKIPVLSREEGYAYFEGNIVPMSEAKVSVATHALQYGTACCEGIRGYWNANHEQLYLLKLREHYERMSHSWNCLNPSSSNTFIDLSPGRSSGGGAEGITSWWWMPS